MTATTTTFSRRTCRDSARDRRRGAAHRRCRTRARFAPSCSRSSRARAAPARVGVAARPLFAVGLGLVAATAASRWSRALRQHAGDVARRTAGRSSPTARRTSPSAGAKRRPCSAPRHVRVEGAALLDVAPGKGPFVVETARGRIEVLGTRFLVDGEADQTTAAVVRGEVKLASDDGRRRAARRRAGRRRAGPAADARSGAAAVAPRVVGAAGAPQGRSTTSSRVAPRHAVRARSGRALASAVGPGVSAADREARRRRRRRGSGRARRARSDVPQRRAIRISRACIASRSRPTRRCSGSRCTSTAS